MRKERKPTNSPQLPSSLENTSIVVIIPAHIDPTTGMDASIQTTMAR